MYDPVQSIDKVLEEVIRELGLWKGFKRQSALSIWSKAVGEDISERTNPVSIRNGILFVGVTNSMWLQQLIFMKSEILAKLNEKLGGDFVKDIHFRVTHFSYSKTETTTSQSASYSHPSVDVELDEDELKQIDKLLVGFPDQEVRDRLYKFLVKDAKRQKGWAKQGYVKCKLCGAYHKQEEEICPICQSSLDENRVEVIKKILEGNPWLRCEEILAMGININRTEYRKAKFDLISKYRKEMEDKAVEYLKERIPPRYEALKDVLYRLTYLERSVSPVEMNNKVVESVVGKRIMRILRGEMRRAE